MRLIASEALGTPKTARTALARDRFGGLPVEDFEIVLAVSVCAVCLFLLCVRRGVLFVHTADINKRNSQNACRLPGTPDETPRRFGFSPFELLAFDPARCCRAHTPGKQSRHRNMSGRSTSRGCS